MARPLFPIHRYKHPRLKFVVRSKLDGKWHRRFFETEREAKTYVEQKEIELLNGGIEAATFPAWLRVMAQECNQKLNAQGKTLRDATEYYLSHLDATAKSCKVELLVSNFLEGKESDGASARYMEDLRSRLGRFKKDFYDRVASTISSQDIDEWLRSLNVAPITRNNFRRVLIVLFNHAKTRAFISDNPAATSRKAKSIDSEVKILTVEQTARLLESASQDLIPYLAIGTFAGLRPAELVRLEWNEIDLKAGLIEVRARKSKTARRRFVRIQPNLKAWLLPYASRSGFVCPNGLRRLMNDARENAGLAEWPSNALRHSFASYHLARFKDAAVLALEMGHTDSGMIFSHYRQIVKPASAAKYWKISPSFVSESIVPFRLRRPSMVRRRAA